LSRGDTPVAGLKVKVRADWSLPDKPEKQDMAAAGVEAFRELDAVLPDGDLKAAVERLLSHHKA
jgi:hypothetical protein